MNQILQMIKIIINKGQPKSSLFSKSSVNTHEKLACTLLKTFLPFVKLLAKSLKKLALYVPRFNSVGNLKSEVSYLENTRLFPFSSSGSQI